ncbi:MAG: ABC transporter ATP-binding protein [Litoreibacter sp.]|uniref:ABC transporter ATP-binding protein n=1 Tax=Litoreibacter sp. TaxID=1969459 RepID=UPI003296DB86
MTSTPVLNITDYSLTYSTPAGPIRILENISLEIAKGEVLGLVGESGSAKSSLAFAVMRDLPGRIERESGSIQLQGVDLTTLQENELTRRRGKKIAMVFQNAATALDPTQSLGAHLAETLRTHRLNDSQDIMARVHELFELVGLPDPVLMAQKYPHEVSGGEKQRVVLAMAISCEPDLILFDEPTSALDATTAVGMLDLFAEMQKKFGVAGLFISHDLGVVSEIADRVAVIYGGRIVETAAVDDLFANPKHPYTRSLLASLPRPSDTRTKRGLRIDEGIPPTRRGAVPACNFSHRCPKHDPAICDNSRVSLMPHGSGQLACARPDAVVNEIQASPLETSQATNDTVLEVENLTVRLGRTSLIRQLLRQDPVQVHAVNNVNLTLHRGETLSLVGESGCGKSSLARALVGLGPFEGELRLEGRVIETLNAEYRASVQIIFQNPDSSLNPRHRLATILSRALKLYRPDIKAGQREGEIVKLMEQVRLPAHYKDRYPHQLSGGEKQRVAIARAIAAQPKVIICDEITSGLDAAVQASIVALLRQVQQETGVALLFITHDLAILRHIAHRTAVMYLGEIVETRSVQDLDQRPYHPYTEALLSSSSTPDSNTITRRVRLTGDLPVRTTLLKGCGFESRCPRRIGTICHDKPVPLHQVAQAHTLKCHHDTADLAKIEPVWQYAQPHD